MIALGVLLLILGIVFGITFLWVVGLILIVLGAVMWRSSTGPFNGRWY